MNLLASCTTCLNLYSTSAANVAATLSFKGGKPSDSAVSWTVSVGYIEYAVDDPVFGSEEPPDSVLGGMLAMLM